MKYMLTILFLVFCNAAYAQPLHKQAIDLTNKTVTPYIGGGSNKVSNPNEEISQVYNLGVGIRYKINQHVDLFIEQQFYTSPISNFQDINLNHFSWAKKNMMFGIELRF